MAKKNIIDEEKIEVQEKSVKQKPIERNMTPTIILGIVGLILLFLPEEFNKIIGYIVGSALLLAGAITIIKYFRENIKPSSLNLVSGILYAMLGIIVIVYPLSIMNLATLIFGVYLIVNGTLKLHNGYVSKNIDNTKWQSTMIAGGIIIIFGLILIINPFSGLIITKIAGAFLAIVAIFDLINEYILKN